MRTGFPGFHSAASGLLAYSRSGLPVWRSPRSPVCRAPPKSRKFAVTLSRQIPSAAADQGAVPATFYNSTGSTVDLTNATYRFVVPKQPEWMA